MLSLSKHVETWQEKNYKECLLIIVCVNVPNESWGLVFLVLSEVEARVNKMLLDIFIGPALNIYLALVASHSCTGFLYWASMK